MRHQLLPGQQTDPFTGQPVPGSPQQPETDPAGEIEAAPPGWGPAPEPPPGPRRPDQPSPAAGGDTAGGPDSPPSSPRTPVFSKTKAGAYAAIARALLTAIGGYLNMLLAVSDDDDVFLPDEDDQADIPPPLGNLAARNIPLGDAAENWTNIQDIGAALVGLAAYAAKGLTKVFNARRDRRRAERGATIAPDLPAGDG
jgi:hypothetical protein